MRRTRLSIALALTVLVGGAALAPAEEVEETVPAEAQPDTQASPQRPLLPEELQQVLTPQAEPKAPVLYFAGRHPCSVSIPCESDSSVSCSTTGMGQSCYYRWDYSPTYPGYVKCGNTVVSCAP
ncbi:MAG TPA: hypothetical protein VEL74_04265 [Thermoanaerobaculia bacterium]|nr:hypothetical protein [Thermoanaerobaculia bacterium]